MANLTPYIAAIEAASKTMIDYGIDPRDAYIDELKNNGFTPPGDIEIGRLQRIAATGDKGLKQSGWSVFHLVDDEQHEGRSIGIAVYGSWRGDPERITWSSRPMVSLTMQQKIAHSQKIEAIRLQRDEEQARLHNETAVKAAKLWQDSLDATTSAYLTLKQITPFNGLKSDNERLILPVTIDDKITSLAFIKHDGVFENGTNKKFMYGGRKKGCYFKIEGTDQSTVYIAEGIATARSLSMATNAITYIAFDAGNLYEVANSVKSLHPGCRIIIAADNDAETDGNPGIAKARQAAEGLGLSWIAPPISGDWNDYHCQYGLEKLTQFLKPALETYKAPEQDNSIIFDPPGILGEIFDYYNATNGNKNPLFGIQTAIAIGSIVTARNYETNFSNRSSLFLLNIGKSATGKEHGKTTIERILEAANLASLRGMDAYTSGSAVLSALIDRPRHLTVIDEFSKYMEAAQNKYSSGNLAEANTQLMQAIAAPDGTMRPKAYSTFALKADKRKELSDMKVINPAITLFAMSTPEFFDTINVRALTDGFLNRFIVCISDAERSLRQHKGFIAVPESIIEWCRAIEQRHGNTQETHNDKPNIQSLTFTVTAMNMQREFQQFCIDKANALEEIGLAQMPGRSNEMAMRLAMISALARNPLASAIDDTDMQWGISWIKYNFLALVDHLKMSVSASEHESEKKEILKAIRATGDKGVTWNVMQKRTPFSKYKRRDLKEILETLKDADLIDEDSFHEGGRGRPTLIYKALA